MPDLEFDIEWESAHGIKGPELASTWASLLIRVNSSVLTRVLDHRDAKVRERINVPLYPLAEWLATNWWFLLNESVPPLGRFRPSFEERHRVGPSREGYYFPNMYVVPEGASTCVAWSHDRLRWTRLEFLNRTGHEWIDTEEFRQACAGLIETVVQRLASFEIKETLLQEEWDAIQSTDEEERRFCETASALGWDPYAIDLRQQERVIRIGDFLSGSVLKEAIPILNVEELETDVASIRRALEEGQSAGIHLKQLTSIRDAVVPPAGENPFEPPWKVGYTLARQVRGGLGLDGSPLPSWRDLGQALNEDSIAKGRVALSNAIKHLTLVDGVVTTDEDGFPAFAFRYEGSNALRFHFCRGLANFLVSPLSDTLLTRSHSDRQKQGRAFAAEFLAPAKSLRARVRRNILYEEDVGELATEFGVSPFLIKHQVENHGIAEVDRGVGDWSKPTANSSDALNWTAQYPYQ